MSNNSSNPNNSGNEWQVICRVEDIPVLGARRVARPVGVDVAVFRNAENEKYRKDANSVGPWPECRKVLKLDMAFNRAKCRGAALQEPCRRTGLGRDAGGGRCRRGGASRHVQCQDGCRSLQPHQSGASLHRTLFHARGVPAKARGPGLCLRCSASPRHDFPSRRPAQ